LSLRFLEFGSTDRSNRHGLLMAEIERFKRKMHFSYGRCIKEPGMLFYISV
jgi:hypothetical protein